MRLSDAIKLGAMLKPQGFCHFVQDDRTCALGAAGDACGVELSSNDMRLIYAAWPWLDWKIDQPDVACPACSLRMAGAGFAIVHLNDNHRWTREAIAAWVATIEPAQETTAVDPSAQHRERSPRAADLLLPSEVFVRAATG